MFFCPDGIPPNSSLTGPNNTNIYICIYCYELHIWYLYDYRYKCYGLEGPEMNNTKRYKVYSSIYLWKYRH